MSKPEFPFKMYPPKDYPNQGGPVMVYDDRDLTDLENQGYTYKPGDKPSDKTSGGSRRRRSLRKYKKSKRVFRKKSRATRRR
jgi:hypothetical protein